MKGANTTGAFSVVQTTDRTPHGTPLHGSSLPSGGKRSLHVSIQKRESDPPAPQCIPPREEEHRSRLVSLGEHVGCLAHDIRNPLSSIEWFATLLSREHHSQTERQELAEHCIQAVRSLNHLVSNMLVLSAPLDAPQEPISLSRVLDDVELLAMYPLCKKRLTLQRRQDVQLDRINGHESLLKQVLLNILLNAIHASNPDSSIEIYARKESRIVDQTDSHQAKEGIVLGLRDYGCGMSEEERIHMFRPFFSKRKGGTGLGLSIVKQIIHMHHGLIDITSQEGKGTTVELFFPQ